MFNLPAKLRNFTPYQPLTGEYEIRLDANESFVLVSPEKIAKAIDGLNLNRYPDPYATVAVKAFARLFGVNPDLVTAGNGSDELISVIISSLLQKGDKVLCLEPDFAMYSFYSSLDELEVLKLQKDEDMAVDIDKTIGYVNKNGVKCVVFSNPCNPTSLGVEKSGVKRLIDGIKNTDTLVVIDEAYMDFWDENESLLGDVGDYDNLIVLRTCSKSVALAGIRLGFAVANPTVTNALKSAKSPYNVNMITQAIGAAVLSDANSYKNSIELVKKSAAHLYSSLVGLNIFERIYETKTNFVFVKTPRATEIYEHLLGKSVAVRNFGNYLRICAGTAEENEKLTRHLTDFIYCSPD